MSCYLPIPPRAWSRVQNSCSVTTNVANNGVVKMPYTNKLVPASLLGEKLAMLNKGNVLQYKSNSSNLTQTQRYSKIAQGLWTNRNTTWATQGTSGYSNPNTTSLKRSGNVINLAIDPITGAIIGPTDAPVTCLKPIISFNEGLPPIVEGTNDDDIPPPVPPTPGSSTFPPIIPDTPVEPIVIQDGGSLICSIQENVCTGEIKANISQTLCNPTSDSDVPGPIQLLCWDDGTPTWYPRQRFLMTNSTDKWPVNYKFFTSAIRPPTPELSATIDNDTIILTWSTDIFATYINGRCSCLPISSYNIYVNQLLYQKVAANINSLSLPYSDNYIIYVTSVYQTIESFPSNLVNG